MKHLKLFENRYDNTYAGIKYHLIPTDNRLENSLKKIGCSDYYINQFMSNTNIKKYKFIFINNFIWCGRNQWSWNKYYGIEQDKSFEDRGSIYGGKINIENHELQALKYNL